MVALVARYTGVMTDNGFAPAITGYGSRVRFLPSPADLPQLSLYFEQSTRSLSSTEKTSPDSIDRFFAAHTRPPGNPILAS